MADERCSQCAGEANWEVIRPGHWEAKIRAACDVHLASVCDDVDDGLTISVRRLK